MSTTARAPLQFAELATANHLIGDPAGLEAALERDGYWFFRDVLDHAAVADLRRTFVAELARQGVVDPADPDALYNGKPFDADLFRRHLREAAVWRDFVAHPRIDAFFHALFGEAPHWIPNIVTRGTPPVHDTGAERLVFIHQDGPFNLGIPFFVTWVPLAPISADMGGVALAEAMHRQGNLHPWIDGFMTGIGRDDIPVDRWRRTDYRPGDLLMMDVMTPHSGLSNLSDRFRFSIDLRVMRASGDTPLVGVLTAIGDHSLTVRDERGEHDLALDEDIYCRGMDGKKVPHQRIAEAFPIGSPVLVGRRGNRATVMRPPH